MAEAPIRISTEHLTAVYGKFTAVKDVSLAFRANTVNALIGPSGCGKSTYLRTLNRMHELSDGGWITGKVLLDGEDIYGPKVSPMQLRRRIGMVFQSAALFDSMTVADNVAYGLRVQGRRGMKPEAVTERVAWALGAVGLGDAGALMPAELSGGMRKRVGVARTIALRPEVVLYDEPTTGLDPINSSRIGDLIADLRKRLAVTSVIVTHDLALAYRISDRLALLHEGRVAAIGTVAEVMASTDPVVRELLDGRAAERG